VQCLFFDKSAVIKSQAASRSAISKKQDYQNQIRKKKGGRGADEGGSGAGRTWDLIDGHAAAHVCGGGGRKSRIIGEKKAVRGEQNACVLNPGP